MFLNRRACCLDAGIKWDNWYYHILCQMGQGHKSIGLAWHHNDRSRPSTNSRTQGRVSTELGLSLHVACATRDPNPFRNKPVLGTVGQDQTLGDNRRSCSVFKPLGWDLNRSFSTSKHCGLPSNRMGASAAYVVWNCQERPIYPWGREYQHAGWSVCGLFLAK